MKWYFVEDGQKSGPHEESAFEELIRSGRVGPRTLVWRPGMETWRPLEEVGSPQAPPPVEPAAHEEFQEAEEYEEHDDSGGGAATSRVPPASGARGAPGALRYAGFWIRVAAKFIDSIVIGVVSVLGTGLLGAVVGLTAGGDGDRVGTFLAVQGFGFLFQMAFQAAYVTFFLSRYAATPGKMVAGLVVVRSDGSALATGRALGRYFGEWLSYFTLGFGYLMVAFDDENRALHDRVCDTRVVYKTPRPLAGTPG